MNFFGMAHEKFEQRKFFAGELRFDAGAIDATVNEIEREVADLQFGLIFGGYGLGAAMQRPRARKQFGKGERLGQLIICAAIQPSDFHFGAVLRGQNKDGCFLP